MLRSALHGCTISQPSLLSTLLIRIFGAGCLFCFDSACHSNNLHYNSCKALKSLVMLVLMVVVTLLNGQMKSVAVFQFLWQKFDTKKIVQVCQKAERLDHAMDKKRALGGLMQGKGYSSDATTPLSREKKQPWEMNYEKQRYHIPYSGTNKILPYVWLQPCIHWMLLQFAQPLPEFPEVVSFFFQ